MPALLGSPRQQANSYINVTADLGNSVGMISLYNSIVEKAEAYKPKQKTTYKMIKEYISVVKRGLGLPMYDALNAGYGVISKKRGG